MSTFCLLIPTYNPTDKLIELISALENQSNVTIIIVDDGSNKDCQPIFDRLIKFQHLILLHHAVNLGKGAALKTGLNYSYLNYPNLTGIVTADGDGQHSADDILAVGKTLEQHLNQLVIGVRNFENKVPFRSKIGNLITRNLFKAIVGIKISDTQSGLRGIPHNFIPKLLEINSQGYEFELDVLLKYKNTGGKIIEKEIKTIYIDDNKDSHFNPIIDSLKIYFELFRSAFISLLTAILDNFVFFISFLLGGNILVSQVFGRAASVLFNYPMAKKYVFISKNNNPYMFLKFIALVIISGAFSYGIINFLMIKFASNVMFAKISAEIIIYFANFCIQRDFIF